MAATTAAVRRLPGIRFDAQPVPPPRTLPRMDVAGFVGFAATGPLDLPVAVADMAQFTEVFGAAAPLFRDPVSGRAVAAYLAPTVRAFFRNGGLRCWVVRVAGHRPGRPGEPTVVSTASRARFPVPGLARPGADGLPEQAHLAARAAGSWADDLAVSAGLLSTRLVLAGEPRWDPLSSTVDCLVQGPVRLAAGDLIRVTYPRTGVRLLFAVTGAAPAAPGDPFGVTGTGALWLAPWAPDSDDPIPATAHPAPTGTNAAVIVPASVRATGPDGSVRVELDVAPERVPAAGTLLRIDVQGGQLLLPVERVRVAATSVLSGRLLRPSAAPPEESSPPAAAGPAEVLTFELRTRLGDERLAVLGPLGFHPDHARYGGALPADEELYATVPTTDDPVPRPLPALWREVTSPRFPLAGVAGGPILYPIGMDTTAGWSFGRAEPQPGRTLERDGLGSFDAGIFLDPALAGSGTGTTLETADYLRYRSARPRDLVGVHALLTADEVTLVAVPDAVHRPWRPAEPPPAPTPPAHEPFERYTGCNHDGTVFEDCVVAALPAPTWAAAAPGPRADRTGNLHLAWYAVEHADAYLVEETADVRSWRDARLVYRGPDTAVDLYGLAPGEYAYRMRALAGPVSSDWSDGIAVAAIAGEPWMADHAADPAPDSTLLGVHRSVVRMCAARGDLLAVLSVPRHYREDDVAAHTARLHGPEPTGGSGVGAAVLPISGEERTLSFGALYHPWPVNAPNDRTASADPVPPDGAATGILAKRALLRGAWVAPANEVLTDVVALEPRLAPASYQGLQDAQVNAVRHEPRGYLWLSADTLSDDTDLRPVNVRRLVSLLRRVALRDGPANVFEPNDDMLRRQVRRSFEAILSDLLVRGAFAAATAEQAYRVVIGDPPNTGQSVDQGRLIVELKVAPSVPLRYLTVRLVHTGGRVVATEGV